MTLLIDRRNWNEQAPIIRDYISKADFMGLDIETHDDDRHAGLNQLCGYDAITRKKSKGKKLVFDHRRTTLCGMSLYTEDMREPVYINVGHADVENRITHDELLTILTAKREGAYWVAHNAPFEVTMLRQTLNHDLVPNIICTLQMAVSAHGPQQYSHAKWATCGVGGIETLIPQLVQLSFEGFDPETKKMSGKLEELVGKITAKESDAAHSYNGLINSIAYGYGLKQAIHSHFGVKMTTFDECLGDKAHMGQLTGPETAAYGGDDAFWALRLFRHLMTMMDEQTLRVFFEQENPMVATYANIWQGGMRVNFDAIEGRVVTERDEAAKTLRRLRAAVRQLLPFPDEPNAALLKREKWYEKNYNKYRTNIAKWALLDDVDSSFEELSRAAGSVSHNWMKEEGKSKSTGPNFSHYMPVRTLMYDLIGAKLIMSQGKVQSDGEARGKLKDKLDDKNAIEVIDCINALAGTDQRMKLYIAPYRLLTDPDTLRLYPVVTSMLATRRMAARDPNPMQLAKRGESTWVRGFFVADEDDEVIVSIDWSAVELVEIGEFSGDPEFIKAFGQLPHDDLHSGSAAAILNVESPGLTTEIFKDLRHLPDWDSFMSKYHNTVPNFDRLKLNLKGEPIDPKAAYKYWRPEIGKTANFGYWYSGFLHTIGEAMGWGIETTAAAADLYRQRFAVAEQWRLDTIARAQRDGFIRLPDGHRYTKYEATNEWFLEWCAKFVSQNDQLRNYNEVIRRIGQRLARRAGNQAVNAYIQGTCATLAKRSARRIESWIMKERLKARFMIPVHDELVSSVHRRDVAQYVEGARAIMIDHPDLFQKCKLDASPSVGLTFEPWHEKKARLGQVELYEPPALIVGAERADKRLDAKGVNDVVDWLFEQKAA